MVKKNTMNLILLITCLFWVEFALASASNNVVYSSDISVSFENGSAKFEPGPVTSSILESAKSASMIVVNGRTSSEVKSDHDERLALSRVIAARRYLIQQGVSAQKIMINYVSAEDYATGNNTPEGRFFNQRVDIQLIYSQ